MIYLKEKIYKIFHRTYSIKELSDLILDHNKNLVMAGPNQYLLEKEKLIDWISYNTPIMTDPTITPMTGIGVGQDLRIAKVKYIEWIIASSEAPPCFPPRGSASRR